MPESLFKNSNRLRPTTLLKKRLWHRCFLMNFVKFVRTPFLQNIFGRLLLIIWVSYVRYSKVLCPLCIFLETFSKIVCLGAGDNYTCIVDTGRDINVRKMFMWHPESHMIIWDKVFKNGPSKFFSELSSTNFTWSIPEYFVPSYVPLIWIVCLIG